MTDLGRRIAIVGAGFSGSLLAVHLLRRSGPDDRIYLFERNAEFGRGLAYATGNPHHLLNVRAGNMSAFSDQPDHFLDWLRLLPDDARDGGTVTHDRLTFASRQLYGSYIQHILGQEIWGARSRHRLHLIADEAVALRPGPRGHSLEVGGGRRYQVDAVALAMGNFPPEGGPPGYAANPWDPAALASLDPDATVLLVGTGLTMVDTVISLLDLKHRGAIHAISRRGLLPRTHAAAAPIPRFLSAATAPRSICGLLMAVRNEINRQMATGGDWRAVIDSLRPETQAMWRNLPLAEKRRFLRHMRAWWDVHRHRMAPSIARRIEVAIKQGRLTLQRARLGRMTPAAAGMDVELLPVGGGAAIEIGVGRVINCSGPIAELSRIRAPLIRSLLDRGAARADPLNLGLEVSDEGAVVDHAGRASGSLFAVGPITKGVFWETTAVPDIRVQCERLAAHMIEQVQMPWLVQSNRRAASRALAST
jgi:uncharacterized NAD(P)/FAD-binding protein YdhS